jgi:hypothetical protein
MPRPPRLELTGVAHHVIQRGNNRAACFFGDADRRFYLKCLAQSAARRGCEVNYLLTCQRYIELNPVRAGLVSQPGQYPWSSHSYYTAGIVNNLITEHPVYLRLGSTAPERRAAYLSLFTCSLDERVVVRIREAINSDSAFGSEAFLDDAEAKLGRSVRLPTRGRPAKGVTGKLL